MSDTSEIQQVNIDSTLQETRVFETSPDSASSHTSRARKNTSASYAEAKADPGKFLGKNCQASCTGSSPGTRFSSGMRRGRNGLSAERSTSPTTVSTAMCRPGAATRPRSSGKANRAKFARSLISNCCAKSEVRQCAEVAGRQEGRPRRHLHGHVPELPIAMLACARIGAPHSVDLRRILGQRARRPHQRLASRRSHHAGRRPIAAAPK